MWIALLLLTWGIEGVGGVWFCYHYWTFPGIHSGAGTYFIGPGNAVVQVWNDLVTTLTHEYAPHRQPAVLTQEGLAHFFLTVYVAFHVLALVIGVIAPMWERSKLGVRKRPSGREVQRFEQVFAMLQRAQATTPDAPPLKRPRVWKVRDADQGMQMRWIGLVLVIDSGLLDHRHFPPLLAHELAHVSSFDLLTRRLSAILPPFLWSVLTLVGLPLACGPILLHLAWMMYWRDRVFAADEYAARLGQRHALKRALDGLKWMLDGGRATKGGRWLRETPYIEERIDRLDRYQPPLPQAVV
ncbi:MAG: hypothetical protein ACRDIV_17945 [Ktedonobacteraceae bacterium]